MLIPVETYNKTKKIALWPFLVFVVLFFIKEFLILLDVEFFLRLIPDLLFLIIFLVYLVIEFLPIVKPEWIIGYELPSNDDPEEEEEIDPKEKELKDLEKIAL